MLPKTSRQEHLHRQRKRSREIQIVLGHIAGRLPAGAEGSLRVLEFGIGSGFQLPYLQRFGSVAGLDQYLSEEARAHPGVELVEGSITATPFAEQEFDLIYSNHVIEHIEDLPAAFAELRRIGKPDCLYAFSVPTNIWLLLAIPGQYYGKVRKILRPKGTVVRSGDRTLLPQTAQPSPPARSRRPFWRRLSHGLALPSHGVETDFIPCYRSFRAESWRKLFLAHGFKVESVEPLLLYGPSQWPIIPILPSIRGLSSSVLVLLRK